MKITSSARRWGGQISGRTLISIIVAVIVLAVIYLLYLKSEPAPEPVPPPITEPAAELVPARPIETVEPAQSAEERGDTAREVIATLKANPDGVDYAKGYVRAQEFQLDGRLADAQLLYFFTARGGYEPAAFDLATFNDPNHYAEDNSLMDEPDAFQAYKWYRVARDAGNETAGERLAELRVWAEQALRAGDAEAERLLLQWEE